MKERIVEITDKTLVVLWNMYGDRLKDKVNELKELTKLIYVIGSDFIEITPELYDILFPLPKGIEFRINVNQEINISSAEEVEMVLAKKYRASLLNNVRVTGLDDLMLYNYEDKFMLIMDTFGRNMEIAIGNKHGCSTALTLEWIHKGGNKVITSFAGIGGYTPLEELLCSIEFLQKINLRGNHVLFPKVVEIFEKIIGKELPLNKPFVGKALFEVESGIHVDGIIKNPKSFEPYDPKKIGRSRKIVIGKFSGAKAIETKLQELNFLYDPENINCILEEVKNESTVKKRSLEDYELLNICRRIGA
jgi:homocitrate synthase NifV